MSSEKDAGALFDEMIGTAQPEAAVTPEVEQDVVQGEQETQAATPAEPSAFDLSTLPVDARSYFDRELKTREEKLAERERAHAQLQADYKAVNGRLAPLQRENAQLKQGRQAPKPVAGTATSVPKPDASMASQEWERVKQEWPEVAGPLEKLITSIKAEHASERDADRKAYAELAGRLDSMQPNFERVTEYTSRLEQQEAKQSVLAKHSDFESHCKVGWNKETDEAWLDPSPQLKEYLDSRISTRQTVVIDSLLSTDPSVVDEAMAEFKEWLGLKYPKGEPKKPEPSARLRASVTPIVKGRGAGSVAGGSFESEGDYFDALQSGA